MVIRHLDRDLIRAGKQRVKRILASVALVLVSIGCFWIAYEGATPPPPAHNRKPANPANADNAAGVSLAAGVPSGSAAGSSLISPSANSATGSPAKNTAAGLLSCQTTCQKSGASCQNECFKQYNVTNETPAWNLCMQGCGTTLSVCSNNCISGMTLPPIATVQPPVSQPIAAPVPAQPDLRSSSQPTQQDQSSPSASSSLLSSPPSLLSPSSSALPSSSQCQTTPCQH